MFAWGYWPFAAMTQEISEIMVTVEQMFRSFLHGSWGKTEQVNSNPTFYFIDTLTRFFIPLKFVKS